MEVVSLTLRIVSSCMLRKCTQVANKVLINFCFTLCDSDQNEGDELLFSGSWSDYGCETTFNSTSTVCKCNHLTHFAILLSARPIQLPPQQTLGLEVTGYIGVGVSLVAMAATIWVFIFLK